MNSSFNKRKIETGCEAGMKHKKGHFTLPGEAGYEDLTLELAEKWGADAIRDSDGTVLSNKIISMGYNVYSTRCLIRIDNAWAKAHMGSRF